MSARRSSANTTKPAQRFLESRPRHPVGRRQPMETQHPHGQTQGREGEGAADEARITPAASLNHAGRRHKRARQNYLIPTTHLSPILEPNSETTRRALERVARNCKFETRAPPSEHRAGRMALERGDLDLRAVALRKLDCCDKLHLCYLCCIWFCVLVTTRRQSYPRAGPPVHPPWPFQHR